MQMRRHAPKALQGLGGHIQTKLAQVAVEKGGHEILPPSQRLRVAGRGEAQRKAAAQPQFLQGDQVGAGCFAVRGRWHHFMGQKGRELQVTHPPGE